MRDLGAWTVAGPVGVIGRVREAGEGRRRPMIAARDPARHGPPRPGHCPGGSAEGRLDPTRTRRTLLVNPAMASPKLVPLDRPEVAPRPLSARLRSQLVYFSSASGSPGVPALGEHEFFFAEAEVARWLDEGTFELVSPLDTANMTEVELSEEQEDLLQWLRDNRVQHARVVE